MHFFSLLKFSNIYEIILHSHYIL